LRVADFRLHRISAGQVAVKGKRWHLVIELESARRPRASSGKWQCRGQAYFNHVMTIEDLKGTMQIMTLLCWLFPVKPLK
jgi:hypothetical protein